MATNITAPQTLQNTKPPVLDAAGNPVPGGIAPIPQTMPVAPAPVAPAAPTGATPTPNINVTATTAPATPTPQVATETPQMVPPTPAGTPVPLPTADMQTFGAKPGENLIGTQINPTGTDRNAIAQQYFDEMQKASNPAYEASLRSATQRAAAQGSLGSGQLNTTYGDLALQRMQNLDNLQRQLQTQATEGTIADKQAAQAALRQERDYQNSLQVQALQQQMAEIALQQNIANQKASFLGSYNPGANIAGAQSYQSQSDALMKALQDMLHQSAVNTNTTVPLPPPPVITMPPDSTIYGTP